jgi:hypothetical protein
MRVKNALTLSFEVGEGVQSAWSDVVVCHKTHSSFLVGTLCLLVALLSGFFIL